MYTKSISFTVIGLDSGCPEWIKELFEFAITNKINTRVHIYRELKKTIVIMKIRNTEEEQTIKQSFPFQADFYRDVQLNMGGSVLVATCKKA